MKNILLLLMLPLALPCMAQQVNDTARLKQTSSISSQKKNTWIKIGLATAYGGLTCAVYKNWDDDIQKASQRNTGGLKNTIARGVTNFGLGKFQTISLVSTSVVALVSKNQRLRKTVVIWGGSLLINTIATDALKDGFQRYRPSSGKGPHIFDGPHGAEINGSFPSAHTSNAFTTATVFATLYKDEKWVAPAAYTLATLVGLSRIHDNAHWASDVLAGAALGFLSAKAMTGLYNFASKKMIIFPQAGKEYLGLNVVYHFR